MSEPREKLNPRARRVWTIGDLVMAVILTVVAWGATYTLWYFLEFDRLATYVVPAAFGAVLVAWAFIRPEVEFRQWRFEIREDEVDLLHGVITRTRQVIPMSRIQHVDTTRGPLQRRYGLATVQSFTAAGAMQIPQLSVERAEQVRDQIATLAKVHDDL